MKRIITILTVVALMVAALAVDAFPALAGPDGGSPDDVHVTVDILPAQIISRTPADGGT